MLIVSYSMATNFNHDDKNGGENIQPHLGSSQFKEPSSLEQINPGFVSDDHDNKEYNNQTSSTLNNQGQLSTTRSDDDSRVNSTENGDVSDTSSYPVMFSTGGHCSVVQEQVVIKQLDGSKVIQTEQCCDYTQSYKKKQKPLRKERILRLKILSIIAIIIYFPLGIPSAYFAFNIKKEFDAGIVRGNIDKAQKYAGRSEKLVIFAIIFAILTAVLVFALVDRLSGNNDSYVPTHRILPGR
ncbi:Hypothetical predicted protein [Mytilus galloprovincialis]|uniref:Interferon-induced transmembrane protein n=2 Tax=Mytilus galloprovincialis TaxID=29158 RepID=A0A8B6HCM6_MYTGA|nr:Hypothetical predicted protein [Mytilus galloprovincialis]